MLIHSCYLLVFIIRSWLPSIFQKWPNEFSFSVSWWTRSLICAALILSEAEAIISLTSGNLFKLATESYWHDPDFNDCVAVWLGPSSILYISYPRSRINHLLEDLWFFKWGVVFRDEGLLKSIVRGTQLCYHAKLIQSCPTLCDQAPLSMGFSRQEYWGGFLCSPPGDLPDLGIKPTSLESPALTGGVFTTSATWSLNGSLRSGHLLSVSWTFSCVFIWSPLLLFHSLGFSFVSYWSGFRFHSLILWFFKIPLIYSIPLLFYSAFWEISSTIYYSSLVEPFDFAICFISRISFMSLFIGSCCCSMGAITFLLSRLSLTIFWVFHMCTTLSTCPSNFFLSYFLALVSDSPLRMTPWCSLIFE